VTEAPLCCPVRPRRAFRLGITGTRNLPAPTAGRLRPRLMALMQAIAEAGTAPHAAFSGEPPLLRLLTCLAEGADRLAARVAREQGWRIHAVLPFAREDYAKDFATPATPGVSPEACLAEFDDLLPPEAQTLVLDGQRLPGEPITTRGYEAAGRTVVVNCDLLVSIWDGRFSDRRGGTGEIVRFAVQQGVPVWWLRADGAAQPRLLADPGALRRLDVPEEGGKIPQAWLDDYLRRCFEPPIPQAGPDHELIGLLPRGWPKPANRAARDGLATFLDQPPPTPRSIWGLHARLRDAVARGWEDRLRKPDQAEDPLLRRAQPLVPRDDRAWPRQSGNAADYWDDAYRVPDAWGNAYADRYRTAYVLVIGLVAVALTAALIGLAWPAAKLFVTTVELLALGTIAVLVGTNTAHAWHRRWMNFRLIAELCRKQHHLSAVGWSLPLFHLPPAVREAEGATMWVGWYFDALARAAPLACGRLDAPRLEAIRTAACDGLLLSQVHFHARNLPRSRKAAQRLGKWGWALFLPTVLIVAVNLVRKRPVWAVLRVVGEWAEVGADDERRRHPRDGFPADVWCCGRGSVSGCHWGCCWGCH
jgi:hypothetical protein